MSLSIRSVIFLLRGLFTAKQANKCTVLLVDDEPDITLVFRRGLELQGFSVETFNEPERALAEFKPKHYDIILIDIRMPTMTGFDLARAIWQQEPHARICFMTAFEIHEDEAKKVFKDLNTYCFLKKPMTPKGLMDHIDKHLLSA